jgi:hypothetical protein
VRQETGSTALLINEIGNGRGGGDRRPAMGPGGFDPTREDLTGAIIVAFATAFLSLATLLVSVFKIEMSR